MSDHLPPELLRQILSKLPVKSLLKFRCVSKAWNFLITNPSFITQHLNSSSGKKGNLFLRYNSKSAYKEYEHFFICPDEGFPSFPLKEITCPFRGVEHLLNIVGICNGLVCLSDDFLGYNYRFSFWNPSVKKHVLIPVPNVTYKTHGPFSHRIGFGFDSTVDDYKLVRLVYLEDGNPTPVPPFVEVYSLRSGCWRMVDNDLKYVVSYRSSCAFVHGVCHWMATPYWNYTSKVILSFDLGKEEFGKIAIPNLSNESVGDSFLSMKVAMLDESLVFVLCTELFGDHGRYSVWRMKEYGVAKSWTKLFNIAPPEKIQRFIAFCDNGRVLLSRKKELILYDPKTKQIWDTNIKGEVSSFYLDNLVESLVLLGEADGSSKEPSSPLPDVNKDVSTSNAGPVINEANASSEEEAQPKNDSNL